MIRAGRAMQPELRAWFVFYTALLLTATHWPGLTVKGPVDRTDLIIHVCAFCLWTLLLFGAGLIRVCGRWGLVWTAVAGLCFAVLDETTQPLFSRVFDLWDLAADCVGVLLAVALIAVWRRIAGGARLALGE